MNKINWQYQKANIEKLIHEKKILFGCSRRSNNNKQLLDRVKDLQAQLNFVIENRKEFIIPK